jgi:hypothetical protein
MASKFKFLSCDEAAFDQLSGALPLLVCEIAFADALGYDRRSRLAGLGSLQHYDDSGHQHVLRAPDLRLCFVQLRIERITVHPDHAPASDNVVALMNRDFLEPAGKFGRDIDLVGFDAPIAGGKTNGQSGVFTLLPQRINGHAQHHKNADHCRILFWIHFHRAPQ